MISKSEIHRKEFMNAGLNTVRYSLQLAKTIIVDGMTEAEIEDVDKYCIDDFDQHIFGDIQRKILDAEFYIGRLFIQNSTNGRIQPDIAEIFRDLKTLAKLQ